MVSHRWETWKKSMECWIEEGDWIVETCFLIAHTKRLRWEAYYYLACYDEDEFLGGRIYESKGSIVHHHTMIHSLVRILGEMNEQCCWWASWLDRIIFHWILSWACQKSFLYCFLLWMKLIGDHRYLYGNRIDLIADPRFS